MSVFKSLQINASGLSLERLKMDIISTNIANVNTTRAENGEAYRKKIVVFSENLEKEINRISGVTKKVSSGVKVDGIEEDESEFRIVYDPTHPDADENGYVQLPNVNIVDEMVSLINTQRAYEANVTCLNANKAILKKALDISKG
ncbi:MAG TPA: flagellar basal body rod protein FlgC [Soehngenia sp.]|nr:flagellar basal body rod protein FlgC [Soehngenia sp.]HPP31389.1 flagellar basal body rod protein FlgC [Soehngenia sp.]